MEIAKRIKNARIEKGWSQRELARRSGIHFNSINAWENNRTKPTKVYIGALEGTLQVTLRPESEYEHVKAEETVSGAIPAIDFEYVTGGGE